MNHQSLPSSSADHYPWSVAVLASRERPDELLATIRALLQAGSTPVIIDVLVNGNQALAQSVWESTRAHSEPGRIACVRTWYLALGDKANTWNQYVHGIWPGGGITFFVDGYARIAPDALGLLAAGLVCSPAALAATGVPSSGRTASQLRSLALREGHLHGNLFAFRPSVMEELRRRTIRLPLGLYGYDGLIGALIAFALDPSAHEWDAKSRILVSPDVTWTHEALKWWRPADLKTHFQRTRKRSLRALVVRAVRDHLHIRRQPPEQMPRTIAELVLTWAEQNPQELHALLKQSPLSRTALKQLRLPRDWSLADKPPELVGSSTQ